MTQPLVHIILLRPYQTGLAEVEKNTAIIADHVCHLLILENKIQILCEGGEESRAQICKISAIVFHFPHSRTVTSVARLLRGTESLKQSRSVLQELGFQALPMSPSSSEKHLSTFRNPSDQLAFYCTCVFQEVEMGSILPVFNKHQGLLALTFSGFWRKHWNVSSSLPLKESSPF